MSKVPIRKVQYVTPVKMAKVNPENIAKYDKYMRSNIIKNQEVKNTTYKTYKGYFNQFLVFIMEKWDNVGLYSDDFFKNAVDIMEEYMMFCATEVEEGGLGNHKKVINTKVSAVSSFYMWSLKRRLIDRHPFDNQIERMKKANDEHIINSYFLTNEQIDTITKGIETDDSFDIQDEVLWRIMIDSANRIGAVNSLTISHFNSEDCVFEDIREKESYRVQVLVEEDTRDLINKWIDMRKEGYDKLALDAIFISFYGQEWKQMDKTTLQRRIQKIGTIIGLDDYHSHCNRKSRINLIYEETGDLAVASSFANHKSTDLTKSTYCKPESKTELRKKITELKLKKKVEKVMEDKMIKDNLDGITEEE